MSPTPGVECRTRAITASTLWPGNCPPSPGFAPCAILICMVSALTRYSVVTPNRPEATCLIAERIESPFGIGFKRSLSSPPSPGFDLPPIRVIAVGRGGCAPRATAPLAAFAGVRLAADPVHGDRQRGVRLARDRAERHGAGGKALDDVLGGLNLVERDRLALLVLGGLDPEQAA